jgi:hypothetical protein
MMSVVAEGVRRKGHRYRYVSCADPCVSCGGAHVEVQAVIWNKVATPAKEFELKWQRQRGGT